MAIIHPEGEHWDAEIYTEAGEEPAEVSSTHSWPAVEARNGTEISCRQDRDFFTKIPLFLFFLDLSFRFVLYFLPSWIFFIHLLLFIKIFYHIFKAIYKIK